MTIETIEIFHTENCHLIDLISGILINGLYRLDAGAEEQSLILFKLRGINVSEEF